MMKRHIILASVTALIVAACAQTMPETVPAEEMERVYEEVKTPYKYGLVIPGHDGIAADSPSVFRKDGKWYMTYIIFDGQGYETWLAESNDLLEWKTLGRIMSFSEDGDWDQNQKAGYIALQDPRWDGSYELEKFKGKYWMSYLGGSKTGYEAGTLAPGMAFTTRDPAEAHEWERLPSPTISPKDEDASWWDDRVIYKNSVIRDPKRMTGHPFVMYYNAKGNAERIGMAVSDDMEHWMRFGKDPVLSHGDRGITGDAYLQRMGKLWVMFYFGFSWNKETSNKAWDSFACSYDLVHWTDWTGAPLIEPSESFDSRYAHKPCMVKWKGVVYHFYCAVDENDNRGIAVATSKPMKPTPLFWTWMDYRPGMDFEAACKHMQEVGIEGVMLNAPTPDDYRAAIPIAHKYGITVHAWLWTMNLEHDRAKVMAEHPEWLSVNRLGRSLADTTAYVGYYKFLCPAIPEVRDYLNEKIKAYCEVEGLDGIAIDYHRFVDVVLPTTLWPNYGVVQDHEYPEWDFGYHPAMIEKFKAEYGYDPREEEDPTSDVKWRQFRCDQISEVANMFAETVHSYGKTMSASPFPTPKMASRMVRQDWGKWDLDMVFPMVYTNFYTMDSSFAYDCTVENVRDKQPKTILGCGIMYGKDIVACMDEAFRGGAECISIFTVDGIKTPEQVAEFRHYTDSVKAVRAANGGKIPVVQVPEKADTDPFNHPGVMAQVEKKMQELVEGNTPLDLGEYSFIGQRDIVRDYSVKDKASGTTFMVSFYLYGDVLSGWNVFKE